MLKIRPATFRDAKSLLKIYAPYVLETTITFEYEVPSLGEFEQRITETLRDYPYLVAENEDQIVGYAYAHRFSERQAYDWAAEISVYVDQNAKRLGVGKTLYAEIERILAQQNVASSVAIVTGQNSGSIAFHEKLGYKQVGLLPKIGFKFDQWIDVIHLQKRLGDFESPKEFVPYSQLNI
ncbi:GNAT family N-acetyltransferase [Companilactobacillus ginsenosidimutans]|uniref:Acetyltransferase n=1 Tax=Companilactobacillus ginsenosidimutans TaxID=1007676 RepID=A0A0H4QGB3_9LACO|nr:GNAT family N-acetyltransferase [Companilactobacillus ginsenosidimutans]AKP67444.1 acetyltransferase [Companilactobacillus ginsenosidimutans]